MLKNTPGTDTLAELRRIFAAHDLGPGARLPTERALADRLSVNRASLRKALTHLEIEGAIVRHVGRGTFVASPRDDHIAVSASPMELMDARLALEPVVTREAALRARPDDLCHLDQCLDACDAAEDFSEFEHWDIAFHRRLAESTRNPIFGMVMETLRAMRSTSEWDRLKRASFNQELRDRYRREHRAILKALEVRNRDEAAAAMFRHLQTVQSALSGEPGAPRSAAVGAVAQSHGA